MNETKSYKLGWLFLVTITAIAIVGYFVGLQSPMAGGKLGTDNLDSPLIRASEQSASAASVDNSSATGQAVPATDYEAIGQVIRERYASERPRLSEITGAEIAQESFAISEEQKLSAIASRSANRAFNGAPPTIPHPVDPMSDASCMACHGEGIVTTTLRASKMSHQFLTHCTQCHVASAAESLAASDFVGSTFTGLPTPVGGPRAFDGAPPQIPHSTWMRSDCMSCHGPTGLYGIRTTHPWQQNCTQCHAPSSTLEQMDVGPQPQFLPGPIIDSNGSATENE